jgi:hypothetical protein
MAALGFLLIAVIVFMFGWNQIGATDGRTTSVIAGSAAVLMAAAVVFQGATVFGTSALAPVGALLLLWAIYGALVAGIGISNTGGRALGLYALFLALAMIAFAVWFFTQGIIAGVFVTLAVAVPFFLQFFEYIAPYRALSVFTGYLLLIAGIISFAASLGMYLGFIA